jgi:hypothetical protein
MNDSFPPLSAARFGRRQRRVMPHSGRSPAPSASAPPSGAAPIGRAVDFSRPRRAEAVFACGIRGGCATRRYRHHQQPPAGREREGIGRFALRSIAESEDPVVLCDGGSCADQPFPPATAPSPRTEGSSAALLARALGLLRAGARFCRSRCGQRSRHLAASRSPSYRITRHAAGCRAPSDAKYIYNFWRPITERSNHGLNICGLQTSRAGRKLVRLGLRARSSEPLILIPEHRLRR